MSTYERKTRVASKSIPKGYEVTFHEVRGYDSPDTWYICEGPGGWKKEVGDRDRAIEACSIHADGETIPMPAGNGQLACYLCRGSSEASTEPNACLVCGGTNLLAVREMAQTHDGHVRLTEILSRMRNDGAEPEWLHVLDARTRSGLETSVKNPCKHCGTFLLEPEWVGSAYCSRRCCVADYPTNSWYAKSVLESLGRPQPPKEDVGK